MTLPNLIVTAEERDFDPVTIQHFRDEGFLVTYIPFKPSQQQDYENKLVGLADTLEEGEKYAIVAYGHAASVVLALAQEPMPKLSALICYYPDTLPSPIITSPAGLSVMLHLTDAQNSGTACKSYVYPESKPGFAGVDFETHDRVASGLAWSRTLGLLRQRLGVEVDLEGIWDHHTERMLSPFLMPLGVANDCSSMCAVEFASKDPDATMATMVAEPYVNHIPTCTGGIGYKDLHRFYRDYFIPGNPPSLKMRLVSRTVGTDRVVDELFVSFRHTQIIPWMLPGIQPTDRDVAVAVVAIVCIRGGRLYHEHIYWDQATVLLQLGLLDPRLVPGQDKARLPVVGADGARKVVDEKSVESNELIGDW